ncbi:glycosyltransferase family 2 protein [Roseospira marina]|uniref:Glycosyltransferase family 2 protein n=1 Tax=Roseospira marina TaxID=140057 RepID=A0A5M6ICL0_9PROT|nr:glycosyltransferase family 2 protein [Roseospira marina]KAA5605943.1 glycosyltransferase family 2 protein [Roseospira marina]MBB4313212.1 glycosyltransferase involved in cell wall biosynthesis [Roseospira marina]MBB5086047.1 glycosyltransferase involved in cell wall biosynthesis [Roseospira marina]
MTDPSAPAATPLASPPVTPTPAVSIVVPMFNEADCVAEFHRRTSAALDGMGAPWEIVAVSDGSTDDTNAHLAALARDEPRLRPFFLTRNTGQWAALSAGFRVARGEYVVVMDADLQNRPEDIPRMVAEARKGFDLVSGRRTNRPESAVLRLLPSRAANAMLRATTGCPARDMGGFKCLRGDVARKLRLRAGQHRLLPALVHLMGGSIGEVDVHADARFAGTSKYGIGRTVDVLFDILMLWFQASFKARPIYLFGRISLMTLAICIAAFLWIGVDRVLFGNPMTERPFFYISMGAGLAAMTLLGFGFVLELLSDTHARIAGQDPYLVRTTPPGADARDDTRHDG